MQSSAIHRPWSWEDEELKSDFRMLEIEGKLQEEVIYITYLNSVPHPGKILTYKNQTEEYDYS